MAASGFFYKKSKISFFTIIFVFLGHSNLPHKTYSYPFYSFFTVVRIPISYISKMRLSSFILQIHLNPWIIKSTNGAA